MAGELIIEAITPETLDQLRDAGVDVQLHEKLERMGRVASRVALPRWAYRVVTNMASCHERFLLLHGLAHDAQLRDAFEVAWASNGGAQAIAFACRELKIGGSRR